MALAVTPSKLCVDKGPYKFVCLGLANLGMMVGKPTT